MAARVNDPVHVKVEVVDLGVGVPLPGEVLGLRVERVDDDLGASSAEPTEEDWDSHVRIRC